LDTPSKDRVYVALVSLSFWGMALKLASDEGVEVDSQMFQECCEDLVWLLTNLSTNATADDPEGDEDFGISNKRKSSAPPSPNSCFSKRIQNTID
jgi:hypothetical protein